MFFRRGRRWMAPLVMIITLLLIRAHVFTPGAALIMTGAIEGVTLLLGSLQAARAIRLIAQRHHAGVDIWEALTESIALFVPRPLARIIALEPRIWLSIFIWLFRRPRPSAITFAYAGDSVLGIFLIAAAFSAPIEVLLVEALIPWGWLRLGLGLLEIYTIVWLLGYWASLAVLPHRLDVTRLMLHYGLLLDAAIPYTNIATIIRERRTAPTEREGYSSVAERQELALVIGGATNVTLTLQAPQTFSGLLRQTPPVTTILLKVDEPDRFVAAITQRLVSPAVAAPLFASRIRE